MKVMVVGGGGREHAIIKKLKENKSITEIFALPGNGGMANDATCVPIGAKDTEKIVEFAAKEKIDYAVVAPDDPWFSAQLINLTKSVLTALVLRLLRQLSKVVRFSPKIL